MRVDLAGRTAGVTGAAGDIGLATATAFAAAGASVVLVDVAEDRVAAACATVSEVNGGSAVAVAADVSDASAVRRYVETALERFGGIDILFNNAGVEGRPVPLA